VLFSLFSHKDKAATKIFFFRQKKQKSKKKEKKDFSKIFMSFLGTPIQDMKYVDDVSSFFGGKSNDLIFFLIFFFSF
jgi:hypothetical protein